MQELGRRGPSFRSSRNPSPSGGRAAPISTRWGTPPTRLVVLRSHVLREECPHVPALPAGSPTCMSLRWPRHGYLRYSASKASLLPVERNRIFLHKTKLQLCGARSRRLIHFVSSPLVFELPGGCSARFRPQTRDGWLVLPPSPSTFPPPPSLPLPGC